MQRRYRLRHTTDFQRLRQEGFVQRHPFLVFSYALNQVGHNRYGFIVAKRLGHAVTRNRTRRILREAVRLLHPQLKQGYDIVLIARPAVVGQPFRKVQRIVYELSRRAELLV